MSALEPKRPATPSIVRRLASMAYESLILAAIAFFAVGLFLLASGGREADGIQRLILQAYLCAIFAAYFLWCWLRGGQTLAMKAWGIRLIAPGHIHVPPAIGIARLALAAIAVGAFLACIAAALAHRNAALAFASLAVSGIGLGWALVDSDGQFLHDRLAGTRLVIDRGKMPGERG